MMTNDRSLPSDLPTQLLIDGEWVDAEASRTCLLYTSPSPRD